MKILVAEDELMMLKTIELKLRRDGHEVEVAENGLDAIEKFRSFKPDLLITDIMMPFFSGLELVTAVKNEAEKKVPILVLSTLGQEKVVVEAFELGADDYMIKPFSLNELTIRVKRLTA